ncbi:MAG: DNA/RNA helicase domain-containing protein [bacterium]
MSEIKTFQFKKESFEQIRKYKFGKNWPVVYLIENGKEAYVGETIRAQQRTKEHLDNPDRQNLKNIHLISDEEYNVSATLDIESWLIQYISAEGSFLLQNGNEGLKNHNYFDKEKYKAKFETIWKKLQEMNLVKNDLVHIRNSDLFKYSPYKALTDDQISVCVDIFNQIKSGSKENFIINGKPGTGKTILAIYLIKYLKEHSETSNLNVALVVPMTQLRGTIKKVFSKVKGLKSSMVIGPNDVTKEKYDILIVDEAHRLKQRKNITNYASFDNTNKQLGLDNSGTELEWLRMSAKNLILFYDANQSIRPSDLRPEKFSNLTAKHYSLISQQRIEAGEEYTNFIDDLFDLQNTDKYKFPDYDIKIYSDIEKMVSNIKQKNEELQLCRIVAGYAWEWKSKNDKNVYDIEIGNTKLMWNSTNQDWVNSPNSINEVGCIHTVQGYDLNYVGVIIGPELSYNPTQNKLIIKAKNYKDQNGWRGITDPSELERYIINIYKTLLTRGIKGTYIYVVDEELRSYLSEKIDQLTNKKIVFPATLVKEPIKITSPYVEMVGVPLVGSAPCGEPLLGESNTEEIIMVEKNKIKPGVKYFILKATGDSMNTAGINNGDLVLCRYSEKGETGDRIVALLGGEKVTIKMYDKKDGRRILMPKSTNPEHTPIIPEEGDMVQGIVQEVIKLIDIKE